MQKSLLFFLLLLAGLSLPLPAQLPSATFHGCEKRCGIYPVRENPFFAEMKWQFKTEGKVFSSPAIHQGTAYIGSEDKNLYAIDTESGKQKWAFETGGAVHSSPACFGNTVYFGSFDGYYYAVDSQTGQEKWRFKTGGEKWMGGEGYWGMKPGDQYLNDLWDYYLSSPALEQKEQETTLYFGSSDGHLYALNAETGQLKWKFKTEGMIHSSPALHNGKVYIGSWDSYLYALDAATGREIWKFKTGEEPGMKGIQASPTIDGGKVYFGARDGYFYALKAETGELEWKYNAGGSWILSTAAIKDGLLYVGTSDSYLLLALDAESGEEKFRLKTIGYVYSSPAIAGNTLFVGDFTGQLFSVALPKGKIQGVFQTSARKEKADQLLNARGDMSFGELAAGKDLSLYATNQEIMDQLLSLGSILSAPAIGEGAVYFGSADGYVYALKLEGKPKETTANSKHQNH